MILKIRITYTVAETASFERVRAELMHTLPDTRQHSSSSTGGVKVWYLTTCSKTKREDK